MRRFIVLATIFFSSTNSLPHYIKPCHLKGSDFNKCALESARYAIPFITKGDKENNVPPMNPLKLPLVEIVQNDFKLILTDLSVYGLDHASVTDLKMNKTNAEFSFYIDNLSFVGQYKSDGKLTFLTLKGSGLSNITAVDINFRIVSTLEPYTKNNEKYLKLNKPTMDFTVKRCYFQFENLLNTNGNSGLDINKILNDNWEHVLRDIDGALKDTITAVLEGLVNRIIENEPEKNIFPE